MGRSVKNLKGGKKELMDFLDEFSFNKMRDRSVKVKGQGKSFIDKTANTIRKASKTIAKTIGLNKVINKTRNVTKKVIKKSSNIIRRGSTILIKKRPRGKKSIKLKKSTKPKKSKKSKKPKKSKKSKKSKK
jgi:hypothetical protein